MIQTRELCGSRGNCVVTPAKCISKMPRICRSRRHTEKNRPLLDRTRTESSNDSHCTTTLKYMTQLLSRDRAVESTSIIPPGFFCPLSRVLFLSQCILSHHLRDWDWAHRPIERDTSRHRMVGQRAELLMESRSTRNWKTVRSRLAWLQHIVFSRVTRLEQNHTQQHRRRALETVNTFRHVWFWDMHFAAHATRCSFCGYNIVTCANVALRASTRLVPIRSEVLWHDPNERYIDFRFDKWDRYVRDRVCVCVVDLVYHMCQNRVVHVVN